METDITTLNDLSIFHHEEESSIFDKLNFTRTVGGREKFRSTFQKSLPDIKSVKSVQDVLKLILQNKASWPLEISNGSVLMIYKFFESTIDTIPSRPTLSSAYLYKLFHAPDFSLVKYSAGHVFDFLKGMKKIINDYAGTAPPLLKIQLDKASVRMDKVVFDIISSKKNFSELNIADMLHFASYVRYHYKQTLFELVEIYYQLDTWYGMAMAVDHFTLQFPDFVESPEPILKASGLYHLLLPTPVAYDVELDNQNNFIFLTGANMAGKSTFIKAVGGAVFLAHVGLGVPARSMTLTVFDGMISNINVTDSIVKGESFFYNEVHRIKKTIIKINDRRKWLILIDELFKGTNIQDAMKCSTAVIEGLIRIRNSLFILSTHLYEIGEDLRQYDNIDFKYFETMVNDGQLSFNYNLKNGISNDRLGFLILKREGVLDLLERI